MSNTSKIIYIRVVEKMYASFFLFKKRKKTLLIRQLIVTLLQINILNIRKQ